MLEKMYQTLKLNMYNDIATCEMMLESANGQINDQKEEEEEI